MRPNGALSVAAAGGVQRVDDFLGGELIEAALRRDLQRGCAHLLMTPQRGKRHYAARGDSTANLEARAALHPVRWSLASSVRHANRPRRRNGPIKFASVGLEVETRCARDMAAIARRPRWCSAVVRNTIAYAAGRPQYAPRHYAIIREAAQTSAAQIAAEIAAKSKRWGRWAPAVGALARTGLVIGAIAVLVPLSNVVAAEMPTGAGAQRIGRAPAQTWAGGGIGAVALLVPLANVVATDRRAAAVAQAQIRAGRRIAAVALLAAFPHVVPARLKLLFRDVLDPVPRSDEGQMIDFRTAGEAERDIDRCRTVGDHDGRKRADRFEQAVRELGNLHGRDQLGYAGVLVLEARTGGAPPRRRQDDADGTTTVVETDGGVAPADQVDARTGDARILRQHHELRLLEQQLLADDALLGGMRRADPQHRKGRHCRRERLCGTMRRWLFHVSPLCGREPIPRGVEGRPA